MYIIWLFIYLAPFLEPHKVVKHGYPAYLRRTILFAPRSPSAVFTPPSVGLYINVNAYKHTHILCMNVQIFYVFIQVVSVLLSIGKQTHSRFTTAWCCRCDFNFLIHLSVNLYEHMLIFLRIRRVAFVGMIVCGCRS